MINIQQENILTIKLVNKMLVRQKIVIEINSLYHIMQLKC